jgi:hypothetical protein
VQKYRPSRGTPINKCDAIRLEQAPRCFCSWPLEVETEAPLIRRARVDQVIDVDDNN